MVKKGLAQGREVGLVCFQKATPGLRGDTATACSASQPARSRDRWVTPTGSGLAAT